MGRSSAQHKLNLWVVFDFSLYCKFRVCWLAWLCGGCQAYFRFSLSSSRLVVRILFGCLLSALLANLNRSSQKPQPNSPLGPWTTKINIPQDPPNTPRIQAGQTPPPPQQARTGREMEFVMVLGVVISDGLGKVLGRLGMVLGWRFSCAASN